MGAYSSNFIVEEKKQIKNLKPTNPQWLFRHAEACGMPFAEVQRCWRRFLQMGPNKKGILTSTSAVLKTDDIFVQRYLRRLPWSNKATLTFQSYLKVCKWYATIDEETKIKVFYEILNGGHPIDSTLMQRILKHVYPEKSDEELTQITNDFISKVDYKKQGMIDEEEFVAMAKKVSFDEIAKIVEFNIIPKELHLNSSN